MSRHKLALLMLSILLKHLSGLRPHFIKQLIVIVKIGSRIPTGLSTHSLMECQGTSIFPSSFSLGGREGEQDTVGYWKYTVVEISAGEERPTWFKEVKNP